MKQLFIIIFCLWNTSVVLYSQNYLAEYNSNAKFNPQTAIRTSLSNYHQERWMTNIPLYIVGDYLTTADNH
ncbi:hypothetical protein FACS189432_02140 [Bacteroidia bacterium]|nr:hypothetical protein FACS189432_02140 [Bacteroidia bacterium]